MASFGKSLLSLKYDSEASSLLHAMRSLSIYTMHPNNYTEAESHYSDLGQMSTGELIAAINHEDQSVANAVKHALPQIAPLIDAVAARLQTGGRLFYIGAGTSGRLGILDASEIPPTYDIHDTIIGIIAGGDKAIRQAVENAEDDPAQVWIDLEGFQIGNNDVVIGIAASGTTPYVLGGVNMAKANGIATGCIVCNANTPIAAAVDYPVELLTGAEFVTGSTRMKAGTAQKMVLNMISTAVMIRLGRVSGNKMVEMQMSNAKLRQRAVQMLVQELNIDASFAVTLLRQHGNVKQAIIAFRQPE